MSLTVAQHELDADATHPGLPFSALIQNDVMGAIRRLIELFTLSETAKGEAGIFLGGEARDR